LKKTKKKNFLKIKPYKIVLNCYRNMWKTSSTVHLMLFNQPHNTYVKRTKTFEHMLDKKKAPPLWNRFPKGMTSLDWYNNLFKFADEYLDDDGKIIVFMPNDLTYELHRFALKNKYALAREWICQQLEPLMQSCTLCFPI